LGVNGIAEPSQGNLLKRRVTNRRSCPRDVSPTLSQHRGVSFNAPRRALENGSMAAAFRGDPDLPNLRRTTIEWITMLPGMRA
jgi:hypothetical protein